MVYATTVNLFHTLISGLVTISPGRRAATDPHIEMASKGRSATECMWLEGVATLEIQPTASSRITNGNPEEFGANL